MKQTKNLAAKVSRLLSLTVTLYIQALAFAMVLLHSELITGWFYAHLLLFTFYTCAGSVAYYSYLRYRKEEKKEDSL